MLFWCSLPHCTWVPAAICALSLGAKGHSGDTQVSPATRLGVHVGGGQGGGPRGDELQGPSMQADEGAGVEDRDLGAPQHPQA